MPIPKPRDKEKKNVFISRCMGNPSMRKDYSDQKKRAGVCYAEWKAKEKQDAEESRVGFKTDVKGRAIMTFESFKGLRRLLKANKSKEKKNMKEKFRVGPIVIMEAFTSLRQALEAELSQAGGKSYLVDFSNNEIIYSEYSEATGETYYKRKYKIKGGVVTLGDSPIRVDRKVTYESANLGTHALVEITDMNLRIKNGK